MIRGLFIVLEGIDGSGTSTQAAHLVTRFDELGLPAHLTSEPSGGPIGSLVRQVLTGRLISTRSAGTGPISGSPPGWQTMSLLFAADRQDHVEAEIEPNLRDGVNVICDRYVYSSIIYQAASAGEPEVATWISDINRFAREPDLVIHLKVDPEIAAARRLARGQHAEIYDDPEFQQQLAAGYDALGERYPGLNLVVVDGSQPVDEVAAACWEHVRQLRENGAPK